LGTNVMTFDQALETPPWKSTASGMRSSLWLRLDTGGARGQSGNRGAVETGVSLESSQRTYSDGDVATRMSAHTASGWVSPASAGRDRPSIGTPNGPVIRPVLKAPWKGAS
jgi:hypothetical protein